MLASLSGDLLALILRGGSAPVRVIVRGDVDAIQSVASRDGFPVVKVLDGFVVLEAPASSLRSLRQVPGIEAISRDARVAPFMSVSTKTMLADQARQAYGGLLGIGGYPAATGKGVGVAVIDSGIATSHVALAGKVAASVSFVTGDSSTDDKFGHGTHIAGIIAGQSTTVTSLYKGGIAPGAHLINVRVLGEQGSGYTSDVIAGIQWTVANKDKYSIRVANLSLGHPVVEPCITDPLCVAVQQATASGLVVVASAGNSGKDAEGRQVLASVTTPGIAPDAITVGALNTYGTASRDDDTVTTYSSRGPTKYELGLKPDVVAPGNKIVSLEAPGSYLAKKYSSLHAAGSGKNAYYTMSGTSMAAAMVSGGAALLLEGGVLTSKQVKLALQLSATFMPNEGIVASGMGSVNLLQARKITGIVKTLTGVLPNLPLLTLRLLPMPEQLLWGPVYDTTLGNGVFVGPNSISQQLIWGDQSVAQQLIWGDNTVAQQLIWGDGTFSQQLIWGDNTFGQQLIWGDQTIGQQLIWGDQTAGQQLIWGDTSGPIGQQLIWGDQYGSTGQQLIWGDQSGPGAQQLIWGDAKVEGEQLIWGDSTIKGDP